MVSLTRASLQHRWENPKPNIMESRRIVRGSVKQIPHDQLSSPLFAPSKPHIISGLPFPGLLIGSLEPILILPLELVKIVVQLLHLLL